MSGFFFALVVFIIVFSLSGSLKGGGGSKPSKPKMKRRMSSWEKSKTAQNVYEFSTGRDSDGEDPKPWSQARQVQMGTQAARHVYDSVDGMDKVKSRHDKNRHRRADWGTRAGPGLLSMKNTLIMLLLLAVGLWVLASIPA